MSVPRGQSMDSFTWRSWSVWRRQCEGRGLRGGEKKDIDAAPQRTCSHVTPYPWIFGEARDDSRPPTAILSRFGPAVLSFFFVPKVKIHSERSPISDDRRDRRNFDTGPTRYSAKRVPELEKTLGAVYIQWRGVLSRRQVFLSCKLINKRFFKKSVSFWTDHVHAMFSTALWPILPLVKLSLENTWSIHGEIWYINEWCFLAPLVYISIS
jgi:hypothetical protein